MTALAANANREVRGVGRTLRVPVATAKHIYKGAIVAIDANGFATPGTDTAGLQVIGIAMEDVNNTGADGALFVHVDCEREFLFTASSITQAMLGDLMVIVDDNTVDDAAGATNDIAVGRLTQFVSTTSGWVCVPGLTTL